MAVVDLATATVIDVISAGVVDFSRGLPEIETFEVGGLPEIGQTPEGEAILLGGFSGLWFEGLNPDNGNLQFLTVSDRGPVGPNDLLATDGVTLGRQFLLPDFQARVITLELNPATGVVTVLDQLLLTREEGGQSIPITGLPNIPGFSETPLDAALNPIPPDPFGSDTEGIFRAPNGNLWTVDEEAPSIFVYSPEGVLIERFVPQGYAALAGAAPGTFGSETLPSVYLERRGGRGFEAIAFDDENNIVYAFIQTPLSNPSLATSNASSVLRILGIDPASGTPVAEFVYLLNTPALVTAEEGIGFGDAEVDRIGDAVFAGDGQFFVVERDNEDSNTAQQFIFRSI
ncbi:MAG: esterase-like activity of phytase family protein [Chloroflexaceae bacterium]|nr:esterase-like activity of phytase family protein [Chloroflexaceae bacterium]